METRHPHPLGGIERCHLIDRIASHGGLVVVTASSGSGKTWLAAEVAERLGRPVLDDLSVPDPAASLGPVPADAVVMLRRSVEIPRSSPPGRRPLRLTERDLWFTVEEVEAVLTARAGHHPANAAMAAALHAGTMGWPLAVTAVADLLAFRPELRRQIDRISLRGPHLSRLLDDLFAPVAGSDLAVVAELANLTPLLTEFFDSDAIGGWEQARQLGVPLISQADGTLMIPGPARIHLAARAALSPERAIRCGEVLLDQVGLVATLQSLLAAGAVEGALTVLLSADEEHQESAPSRPLLAALERLVAKFPDDPRLALRLARVLEALARMEDLRAALTRTMELAERSGDGLTGLRARILGLVQQAMMEGPSFDPEVLDHLDVEQRRIGDPLSAVELLEARFAALCGRHDWADLAAAIALGERVAGAFEALGQKTRAARVLRRMAFGPVLDLGRYGQIANYDARARAVLGEVHLSQPSLVFGAYAAALMGDLRAHQNYIEQLDAGVDGFESSWLEAFTWLSKMVAAALVGDAVGVRYSFQRYEETIGELRTGPPGVFNDSQAVVALALVGDRERAARLLDNLAPRQSFDPRSYAMACLVFEARVGSPEQAAALALRCEAEDLFPLELAWRADLELLMARSRSGSAPTGDEIEEIAGRAALIGQPKAARHLLDSLRSEAGRPRSSTATPATVVVEILGGFRVAMGHQVIEVPAGKPAELVKLLALRGAAVHVESAVDALWPDVDLTTGKRRLKNVVNRARQSAGHPLLARHGEMILLDPAVEVDMARFRGLVSMASAAPPRSPTFVESAVAALELSRRGLLPEDPYLDWAAEDRWTIQSVSTRLLEQLISCPDETPTTGWLIETANALDLLDDGLYLRLARRALAAGAGPAAREALDQARTVCRKLGTPFAVPNDLAVVLGR